MKRFGLGVVWFIVIYVASVFIIGTAASLFATDMHAEIRASHPGISEQAVGYITSQTVLIKTAPFIFLAALTITILGTWKGILPGTKIKTDWASVDRQ